MRRHAIPLLMAGALVFPASARADVVLEWNAIMRSTTAAQNPFAQARIAAITQIAVFEAVNACGGRYEPYLGTVPAPAGASAHAAAVAAAHAVLKHYVPASAATLDAERGQSLAAVPDGQPKWDGIAVGEAAAAAMIALRSADGAAPPETHLPDGGDPGVWQPTPPGFGPGVLAHWGRVATFGIRGGDQFRSDPPPALTSSRYRKDYNEVKDAGSLTSAARPQDRADVAAFYNAAAAVPVWNAAAAQVSAVQGLSLVENARAFALLNMAISDALVSSQETKYFYEFWRPVTAIRAGDTDGNDRTDADGDWTPFIVTPAFPSYPSAHASAGSGARAFAPRLFGESGHDITLTHASVPGVVLRYGSFQAIAGDIDDARVYGGIHFRFDQRAGARQGREVGKYVYKHNLRPRREE